MREIKFRAWNKKTKEIYYESEEYRTNRGEYRMLISIDDIGEGKDIIDIAVAILHKDFIVMQYTGLKDKKGKEIYEGDILKGQKENHLVEWNDKLLQWNTDKSLMLWGLSPLEVIGNFYENPKLIKS